MPALDSYPLTRSPAESRRLMLQARIYEPLTRRLFAAAGIRRGMRVLDLGCGAGDVSLLLAELVGPEGSVLGVDVDPTILGTARLRAADAGKANLSFVCADIDGLQLDEDLDAAVGRWILMYLRDPVAVLRRLASLVRPGGVLAFQENDFSAPPATFPPTPLMERLVGLMAGPAALGDRWTGLHLHRTFIEAGLRPPELRFEAPMGAGPSWPGFTYMAETARSLAPMLSRRGIDLSGLDLETLARDLRDEALAARATQRLPAMVGAWSLR